MIYKLRTKIAVGKFLDIVYLTERLIGYDG